MKQPNIQTLRDTVAKAFSLKEDTLAKHDNRLFHIKLFWPFPPPIILQK